MLLLILTILVCAVLYWCFMVVPFRYWKNKNVPHPPISRLFGNMGPVVMLQKPFGEVCADIYNQYPSLPYVGIYEIRTPCILVRDLDLVRDICIKSFSSFSDNGFELDENLDPLFVRNPFAAKGDSWKKCRNQIAPLFTSKKIKEMYPLIVGVSNHMIKYIESNVSTNGIEAKSLSEKFTTDVVVSCALGLEGDSFINPNSESIRMWKKIMSSDSIFLNMKMLLFMVCPSLNRVLKTKFIPDDVAHYFRTIVTEALKYREKYDIKRGDFLDAMIELKRKLGESHFDNEDITAHIIGFFLDGTETSAVVLCFVLYELALHSDVQTKLKAEIDSAVQKNGGNLDYDTLQEMGYLDQVLHESMRKNITNYILSRKCTKTFCLESPDGKLPKLDIEPGTFIVIPTKAIHHDPKYYPDPLRYDPERFSNENNDIRNRYSFLPFGEGPRICLGQRFGIMQVKIAVVNLIQQFEIRLNRKTVVPYEVDPHYSFRSSKGGIWLDFHKRL